MNSPLFNKFITRTFSEIFEPTTEDIAAGRTESVDVFIYNYQNCGIPTTIRSAASGTLINSAQTLFYLLYARYGNSSIANADENQFMYRLYSTIFMYGPSWEKRFEIQQNLRNLTESDLLQGAKQIYNHAYNPGTSPATSDLTELDAINEQNTTNYKRSKLEAYSSLWDMLSTDVTKSFIDRFENLFIKVIASGKPLLYATEEEDEE